ncbi:hypothetical protein [Lichenifustis flavocetrariae]|uniref:Uncharacterized protein n=1 Tax=Lichenifustis flavocetrariae TaxID=2949735 RepID=A0AA41Z504_9HYPH|nr:hypothetical protein [Lichenifustis flavocetrariae]MCW6509387.1 hypothetical protein [Lichenifustis flavocetrariae]
MQAATYLKSLLSNFYRTDDALVAKDAAALIERWGAGAYKAAAELSWREDMGLLKASSPGHWGRVTLEIARCSPVGREPAIESGLRVAA